MIDIQQRPVTLVTVGVTNRSTLVSRDDLACMIGAVNIQLERDFAPLWGIHWALADVPDDAALSGYPIQIDVVDDVASVPALGYHNEIASGGIRGTIGVKPVLDEGGVMLLDPTRPQRPSVASVLSHEVLEMAADPNCNLYALGPERHEGAWYSREICDPVESLQYTIDVQGTGVAVSDFVTEAFFDPEAPAGTRVDFLALCPGPFQLTAGGYMSVIGPGYQLTQIAADAPRPWKTTGKATSLRSQRRARHLARRQ